MIPADLLDDVKISIHALLAESDPLTHVRSPSANISIHALLAESDPVRVTDCAVQGDFYPRSPCGERPFCQPLLASVMQFLSTLSLRRATIDFLLSNKYLEFLSTLSLRRATSGY